ncbi:hypothetical protein HNV27_34955 [Myxococcus xanthus]|nr:hypothetical protein [Myxococcus xanthus]
MKHPLPDGTTRLFFTGLELLLRLTSLVPPPRTNLTRLHGIFAPGAKVRPILLPQAGAEPGLEEESPAQAATVESTLERTPRLDWVGLLRRTFTLDDFACSRCGGRRRVLAHLTAPGGERAILEHLALPSRHAKLAPA